MTARKDTPLGRVGIQGIRIESGKRPDFNPRVILRWPDRESDGLHLLSFNEFLSANEGALSLNEIQAIADHLLARKVYKGGGGAGEAWTLEVSPI